jgi:hypothetical protein
MSTAELRALVEQGKRLIAGDLPDKETDPIKRLFNGRNLPPNARLRQLYDQAQQLQAQYRDVAAKIEEGHQQLGVLLIRARQLKPQRYAAGAPIPTKEDALELAAAGAHADILNDWLEAQRQERAALEQKRADALREWESSFEYWRQYVYMLTREPAYKPTIAIVSNETPDSFQTSSLRATLAQLEA